MLAGNWIRIAFGFVSAAIGTLPLLAALGILPSRPPHAGDAPAWVAAAIGLAFFLGGLFMIVNSLAGGDSSGDLPATAPPALRAFYVLIGVSIPVLLVSLLS